MTNLFSSLRENVRYLCEAKQDCLLELLGDLIPVVIVILISLWEAVRHLFYQHIQCRPFISFSMTAVIILWQADSDYIQHQLTKKNYLRCSWEILSYLRDKLNNFECALFFVVWLTDMAEQFNCNPLYFDCVTYAYQQLFDSLLARQCCNAECLLFSYPPVWLLPCKG